MNYVHKQNRPTDGAQPKQTDENPRSAYEQRITTIQTNANRPSNKLGLDNADTLDGVS